MVIDTDGSAFITKAEFDSLKNNFQAQIDNYNNSIDSKIDGAIAAYLAGIRVSEDLTLLYDATKNYNFANSMRESEQKEDKGITNLQHDRLAGFYGCTGASASLEDWSTNTNSWLIISTGVNIDRTSTKTGTGATLITSAKWAASSDSYNAKKYQIWFSSSSAKVSPGFTSDPAGTLREMVTDAGLDEVTLEGSAWQKILIAFITKNIENGKPYREYRGDSNEKSYSGHGQPGVSAFDSTIGRVNSDNIFTVYDATATGQAWGVNLSDSVPCLTKWYDTISILNTAEIQNFTYKDGSASTDSSTAWDDTSTDGYTLDPDADFSQQQDGTRQKNTTTATSASTYHRFLASQMKIADNTAWSNYHQLGTNSYESTLRCFNEDCTLAKGTEQTINGDTLRFDRTGYYMNSGALVTKTDNYVTTGDIKYTNLIWASTVYNTNQVKLDSFSNVAGEDVYLGGGIPLAQSPKERTGIKVKLDYEVKKLDGSALTAADGNMNIKLEIANKQFSNGSVASGAVSHDTFTTTVNNTSAIGHWDSAAFNMEIKSKLWLNAYVTDKQGYNVIIKNINVQ